MLNHRWYVKDGSIVSTEVKQCRNYTYQETIAFNIGNEVAQHIVKLHNDSVAKKIDERN